MFTLALNFHKSDRFDLKMRMNMLKILAIMTLVVSIIVLIAHLSIDNQLGAVN